MWGGEHVALIGENGVAEACSPANPACWREFEKAYLPLGKGCEKQQVRWLTLLNVSHACVYQGVPGDRGGE